MAESNDDQKTELRALGITTRIPDETRAMVALLLLRGIPYLRIARECNVSRPTVRAIGKEIGLRAPCHTAEARRRQLIRNEPIASLSAEEILSRLAGPGKGKIPLDALTAALSRAEGVIDRALTAGEKKEQPNPSYIPSPGLWGIALACGVVEALKTQPKEVPAIEVVSEPVIEVGDVEDVEDKEHQQQ